MLFLFLLTLFYCFDGFPSEFDFPPTETRTKKRYSRFERLFSRSGGALMVTPARMGLAALQVIRTCPTPAAGIGICLPDSLDANVFSSTGLDDPFFRAVYFSLLKEELRTGGNSDVVGFGFYSPSILKQTVEFSLQFELFRSGVLLGLNDVEMEEFNEADNEAFLVMIASSILLRESESDESTTNNIILTLGGKSKRVSQKDFRNFGLSSNVDPSSYSSDLGRFCVHILFGTSISSEFYDRNDRRAGIPPPEWHCHANQYNTTHTCNCNCGAPDPDCDDESLPVEGCDDDFPAGLYGGVCTREGVCSYKEVPSTWTCPNSYYDASDGCDCNCGAIDPDCDDPFESHVYGCENDYQVCINGTCVDGHEVPGSHIPGDWTCPVHYYGTQDGCDCGCGAVDLDCFDPGQYIYGCDGGTCLVGDGHCFIDPTRSKAHYITATTFSIVLGISLGAVLLVVFVVLLCVCLRRRNTNMVRLEDESEIASERDIELGIPAQPQPQGRIQSVYPANKGQAIVHASPPAAESSDMFSTVGRLFSLHAELEHRVAELEKRDVEEKEQEGGL